MEKRGNTVIEPLGELVKREMKSNKYSEQLPGGPDGKYSTVEFNSSFKNKKESIETVILMLEDNEWKVIGYFIK